MNVYLPEPDGPIRKTNSPLSILRLTLSNAGRADDLYCLVTRSRVIITARQGNRERQMFGRRGALGGGGGARPRHRGSPGNPGSPGAGAGAGAGLEGTCSGDGEGVVVPGPN